jgi:hypothetical protein
MTELETAQLSINTIRTLSIDAVPQAKSGHPGTPMALAPLMYTLWNRVLHFDPADPSLAESRPVRALEWSRLHAALVRAPSHPDSGGKRGLREAGTAFRNTRGHSPLSPARQ